MSFSRRSRSSVKSSITLTSLEKVMMATRSEGVICVSQELLRGGLGAQLVLDRHGGHIEEHHHQAAVTVFEVPGCLGRDLDLSDGFDGVFSRDL